MQPQDSKSNIDSTPSRLQSNAATSFVFTSKRYSPKEEPMAWFNKKPILRPGVLQEHAVGAIDLGPLATTIPGFTPLSFLQPSLSFELGEIPDASLSRSQRIPSSPSSKGPENDPSLPQTLQFKLPSSPTLLSQSESTFSFASSSATEKPAREVKAPRQTFLRQLTSKPYNLSLTQLIVDEPAVFGGKSGPDVFFENRKYCSLEPDIPLTSDQVLEVFGECPKKCKIMDEPSSEDNEVLPIPFKLEQFSKHSEKTHGGLGLTHDSHGKLTTT